MKLASVADGTRDGRLAVVAPDGARVAPVEGLTLQAAIEEWPDREPDLRALNEELAGDPDAGRPLAEVTLLSPLPRAYQWAEASSYHRHMERLRAARGIGLPLDHGKVPAVYQSSSDRFLRPDEAIPLLDPDWGLDCEATVAVAVDDVPMGTPAEAVEDHIRLVLLTNDLTHRNVLTREYGAGVGFYQAKPARAFAPFAVTPDELGPLWRDGLLHARVVVEWNAEVLGDLRSGEDCAFDFHRIVAHMATTRDLAAGSIIGSGTVSNADPERGYGCIAERRAVDLAAGREPGDRFLRFGDRIKVEAFDPDGSSIFGALDQMVA
ncbi:MAG: fumarylacetoacetate hydrolase family protein [Solirubrobacterales bacterium]|nr:fumarylacetoacetate hydrolase family protein [Solirubrobacterales bacterium]